MFAKYFFALLLLSAAVEAQSPAVYQSLKFRHIGPDGNRTDATAGVPGDPLTYYAGAASGGIWKSVDGGDSWKPIFDDQEVSSIGALAVSTSDPAIVWAGTGEPFIRSHISVGNGMYKSTDAGKTWKHMGLDKTGRISRVLIDPHDPNIVFACSLGHAYTPQPDRGVFRTTDGGATWTKVLFADENTGCSDLAFSPASSHVLLAGMWQLEIHPWGRSSGGPLGGIYKSTDGGTTWKFLTGHGLPHSPVGKVAIAFAPSDANRVYAQIETGDGLPFQGNPPQSGSLWRSEDGGDNWRLISSDRNLAGRFHYFAREAVNPVNENEIYFLSTIVSVSYDGGVTASDITNTSGAPGRGGRNRFRDPQSVGQDNHDIWIDPDGKRIIIAGDFGVSISLNRGKTWVKKNLPIAQMYHATTDNQIPYYVYGNKQDGPSYAGPSNSLEAPGLSGAGISRASWYAVGGGESGFATPDPVDPNLVWSSARGAGSVGGIVVRFDNRTHRTRDVEVWPESTTGASAAEVKYRFQWTFPLEISPFDHNKLYVGSQFVHMTTNGGQTWKEISPDLTLNDRSKMGVSGGLTPDQIGVEYGSVIYAITESPKQKGLIWVGTNDGLVQVTRDEGKTWTNVTANIPGLPPWGQVYHIEASRKDAGIAYVTFDLHQMGDFNPYVYKTADYGKTWTKIVTGITPSAVSYAHCLREDPKRPGLLYLGTENGLYLSYNDGANWQSLQLNLPHAPVYWITVQEHFNDLVLATYGRGFWILDDLSPIQQLTPEMVAPTSFPVQDQPRADPQRSQLG